jgi:hypothetical protein
VRDPRIFRAKASSETPHFVTEANPSIPKLPGKPILRMKGLKVGPRPDK